LGKLSCEPPTFLNNKKPMKKKKLVKKAFQCPDKYTAAELSYMKLWLKEKERQKELRKSTTLQ
jgi:hypothetical protein